MGEDDDEREEGCFLALLSSPDMVAIRGSEREAPMIRERRVVSTASGAGDERAMKVGEWASER